MASTARGPSRGRGNSYTPVARRQARFSATRMRKNVEASCVGGTT